MSGSANNITDNVVFGVKRQLFQHVLRCRVFRLPFWNWQVASQHAADVAIQLSSGWMVAAVMQIMQSHWIRSIYPMCMIFACTTRLSVLLSKLERITL